MYLPDHEIRGAIRAGHLGVEPHDPDLIQPASLDVRLGHDFATLLGPPHLDLEDHTGCWAPSYVEDDEVFVIAPGDFVLAATLETITVPPELLARLEGRSSLGRLGLSVHSTAGFIDPGFSGHVTLELHVTGPSAIVLHPGQRIGQLSVARLSSPAQRPYGHPSLGSHYQGQVGPAPAAPQRQAASSA